MEKEAEIRNRLQAIKTVLEALRSVKHPPDRLIKAALDDIKKLDEILEK